MRGSLGHRSVGPATVTAMDAVGCCSRQCFVSTACVYGSRDGHNNIAEGKFVAVSDIQQHVTHCVVCWCFFRWRHSCRLSAIAAGYFFTQAAVILCAAATPVLVL